MANEMARNTSDKITLERLNQEYIAAFMAADVNWYREHLLFIKSVLKGER